MSTPLRDRRGRPFVYWIPHAATRLLHRIDRYGAGAEEAGPFEQPAGLRPRLRFRAMLDEAVASSQLEGVDIAVDSARKVVREGRRPADKNDLHVASTFEALDYVTQRSAESLSSAMLLDLHRTITKGTLDDPAREGQFRSRQDQVIIEDGMGTYLHTPPPAEELEHRIELMCAFANGQSEGEFTHPVIRAIILHFWLDHDHPFVDGIGRTARALFLWSMLSQGYRLVGLISLSRRLLRIPRLYNRSFLYSQSDDNDLTYFLMLQLRVIRQCTGGAGRRFCAYHAD